ncbi:protein of unknown function [Methylacidimicrobium sp. AP8]|uniref:hypothetical protein n=1 Tax=Methylacidimicrobium sp. AP8 TaxID=2730359 RepID=UPI0018BFB4D9|nr:hypothetical protein [Methylacidimicrobium sp. AP8]CAB4243659.1 protein of unknown function [Methylacidimicrobium sp. AP8]
MEVDTDSSSNQWNVPRTAQRRLFRALPLGSKLAIAADLAELVRIFQRKNSRPMIPAPEAWPEAAAGEEARNSAGRPADQGFAGCRLWSACLAGLLAAALTGSLRAASEEQPTGKTPGAGARVTKFVHLPEILQEEGPRPKNVWVYGRFTARGPVTDGFFIASVNEGVNWPDWEEHFNLIDNPGNYVFRRVVFRTKMPLPEIRKGTKFAIPKEHPARLVEIDQVDGTIARMVLEAPPVIESQTSAGRPIKPGNDSRNASADKNPPRRVVYFQQLGSIAKVEGPHPKNLWTWGNFSARSDLRDGIFTATPAGVESRRVIEWIVGAILIYPIVEIPARAIFYVHQPRRIRNGDRIVITPKHPARVRQLFLAGGGVLTWLDLDPPQTSSISVRLGSGGERTSPSSAASSTAVPAPVPATVARTVTPAALPPVPTPAEIPSRKPIATESP